MPDYLFLPATIVLVLSMVVAFIAGWWKERQVTHKELGQAAKKEVDQLNDEQLQRFISTIAIWEAMNKQDQRSILRRRYKEVISQKTMNTIPELQVRPQGQSRKGGKRK